MQTKSCWVHGKDSGSSAGHYGERLEEGDAEGERAGGTGIMIVLMPPCTVYSDVYAQGPNVEKHSDTLSSQTQ